MDIPAYIATQFQRPEGEQQVPLASPAAAGLGKLAGEMADADIAATKMVGDAARLGEFVARKDGMSEALANLDVSLDQDPDHRTYFERAKKEIEKITTDTLSGIQDPALKNALLTHVSKEKNRHLTEAKHKERALTVDYTRGVLANSIDQGVKRAAETDDGNIFFLELGNIDANVNGGVAGGIYGATEGVKIAREAKSLAWTAKAEQMADKEPGRFLSNYKEGLYKDTVDPIRLENIRRFATHKNQAVDAAAASTAVWEDLGPKRDEDPINEDLMVRALEVKFSGEPDKSNLAIASLKEKIQAHDKGSKERKDANLSAVWKASLAGQNLPSIIAMPEYSALDGGTQRQVKEHLEDRSWTMQRRTEEDPGRKAAQHELYWRYSQPEVLSGMTESAITALYPTLGVGLTDKLVEDRRNLDNPAKVAEAKIDQDDFNHFARAAGLTPEKKGNKADLGEIKFRVENAIDAEQRARGRVLTREEKGKIMRQGLVEVDVRVNQAFWGETTQKKRFFDVQYPENIFVPGSDRDQIAADLSARGLPATDNNIRRLYLLRKEK